LKFPLLIDGNFVGAKIKPGVAFAQVLNWVPGIHRAGNTVATRNTLPEKVSVLGNPDHRLQVRALPGAK
jgi:hypothetical protein